MIDIKNARPGERYLFYSQTPRHKHDLLFTATFLGINSNSFQCNDVECKENRSYNNCGILGMPLSWISKVEEIETDILLDIIDYT
jgi:hypothetical protein